MKIDCHVHLFCLSEKSGGYTRLGITGRAIRPIAARKFRINEARGDEAEEALYVQRLAEQVADSELDRAVLLSFDQVYRPDGSLDERASRYYVPNDYAFNAAGTYPDQFLFGASVHPYRKDALEALAKVAAQGAVLIKLLPNTHNFDPADARLRPYYNTLAELKLPLLLHGGYEHTIPVKNQRFGNPDRFRPALDAGVTLIVAHAGTAGRFHPRETFGVFLKLLETYPNCFGDTAALANYWRSQYVRQLKNPSILEKKYRVRLENPFERLIHGSDFPIPISPFAFGPSISRRFRQERKNRYNYLQSDIVLKRIIGLPESCLDGAYRLLDIGRRI
jgi:uncharacterized protein